MIASLRGMIEAISTDNMIVSVSGIGFRVSVPTHVLGDCGGVGREIKLFTHLHVREDEMSLYGFGAIDELRLFEMLITVSGLGCRTAMAMLSTMSPDQLAMAIAAGSTDILSSVPGIGKRTAERIVLELKDKVGGVIVSTTAGKSAQENADVVNALTSLGYTVTEATRAVTNLPADQETSVEERIKLALQYLGRQ